jgi:hypothetical protein
MVKRPQTLSFLGQSRETLAPEGVFGPSDLDRDLAAGLFVSGQEN